jgi:MFS family permease
MWVASTVGAVVGGAGIPALGVYGAELFPTGNRGRAAGLISVLSLIGSSVGLLAAGWALDQAFGYGAVMGVLAIGPLVVAALVVALYPETAHQELEDLNPEDRGDGLVVPSAQPAEPAGHS